ncbi:MAG: zinc ribbon domain-containing protein YjdM [Proteobacteria bacterium]|nr:zinc ribbon domain-containing protein YjdM [Pseudomonadota bacterium]
MEEATTCPKCTQANVYPDGENLVCADCAHEWPAVAAEAPAELVDDGVIRDVNGVALAHGDSVVLIKSLKLKGSATTLKMGTKITNIRIVDGDHEVDCRVDNMNVMLKAQYLRKV